MGWVKDAAAHHVMAPRLEHQPLPYPVVLLQEMLPLFTHVPARQHRTATRYQSHRVAAGMRIYAKKSFLHYILSFVSWSLTVLQMFRGFPFFSASGKSPSDQFCKLRGRTQRLMPSAPTEVNRLSVVAG